MTRVAPAAPAGARETSVNHGYRPDIDGLRALAIVMVLLYHGFPGLERGGFVGVDVFFVISGYLITGILLDRSTRQIRVRTYLWDFYQRRIRRIFPALIVVLLACAVYGWFTLFPADYQNLTRFIAGGAGFVNNFILASQIGYFDQSIVYKPLMHLWSLAIEEQFYVVWPLLILILTRFRRGKYTWLVLGALVLLLLAYSTYATRHDPTTAYYSPLSRGWELGVGGLLAALHARGLTAKRGPVAEVVSALSLVSIPVLAFFVIDEARFPGPEALLPVAATAALIWFGSGTRTDRHLLGTRPIVFIGLISYPLYLWHWVLLSFLRISDPNPPWWAVVLALAAAVALATGTYFFVERPIKTLPLRRVSIAALVSMALVLLFALGATTFRWSGVTLTPTQVALEQGYDHTPAYRFRDCFLDSATQTSRDFAAQCDSDPAPGEPTVLIWGDSIAAQLYPGLLAQGDRLGYAIAQRTATSCPPATTDVYPGRGSCDEINSSTRDYIQQTRPAAVVINGVWPDADSDVRAQLSDLVDFLHSSGVTTVVIVGPSPDWTPDLRGILIHMTFPNDTLPDRLTPPADTWPATVARDALLRETSADLGVDYFSLVDRLCDGDQCLIKVSDDIPDGLISSDHFHLTAQASAFVLDDFTLPPVAASTR